jgi:3-methyladenine DNA glycosylase AlkD
MSLAELRSELKKAANPSKAKFLSGFFKTGKGEYGEGDIFLGITVPETRKIAIKYRNLALKNVESLLKSKIHEERLCALLLLVNNYENNSRERDKIFDFYLRNTKYINNWDLVDLSSHEIVGDYLLDKKKSVLYKLAKSKNIWERRIAMISTYAFIRNQQFNDVLRISAILLKDKHDLIHKAVGWMLREAGKRNQQVEEDFLRKHYKGMPRTMLRYAIEKFPEKKRKAYLKGEI